MTIGNLPYNLTFEEFKALADREPDIKGNWIYEITIALFDKDKKNPYPIYDLYNCNEKRMFVTYDDAVNYIRRYSSEVNPDVYCSWIRQVPIGEPEHRQGVEWLFDKDGNLIDYTLTHTFGEGSNSIFYGRPESRQRFNEGDIVEVVTDREVKLAVLCSTPPDVDWCWKRYDDYQTNNSRAYGLDYTDEFATYIDGPSYCFHRHVSTLRLMKPRFEIPQDLKKEMMTWLERARGEQEEDMMTSYPSRYNYPQMDGCYDLMANFYNLNLYFQFDDNGTFLLIITDSYGLKVSLRTDNAEYANFKDFNDILIPSQIKALQDYLENEESGKPMWWYMIRDWNKDPENNHRRIPQDLPLPDYTTLIRQEE